MISFSSISNAAAAAAYYGDLDRAAEYYSDAGRVPSRWLGSGSVMQGLRGEVGAAVLHAQLAGEIRDVSGDRKLGIQRDGQFQHRAGWDFTISAPKSVSAEILIFGREDVDIAHRNAVRTVVDYLEHHAAQSRINGHYVKTGNLTAAAYDHVSSRAGDPQKHTHVLIANITFDKDGNARSISNEKLLEFRKSADAIYHQELSRQLQVLGYKVRHDRQGHVEIADYSREALADFSTRSNEIEAALTSRGLTRETASAEARQVAALATRAQKNMPETRGAHEARWRVQAELLGVMPAERNARDMPAGRDAAQIAAKAVTEASSHLTEREAVMRVQDMHREAARAAEGRCTWAQIEEALFDAIQRGELVVASDGRVTTQKMLHIEHETDRMLEDGRGAHRAVMTVRQFDQALARFERASGFALSEEQRAAAHMILTQVDRFQGVQGLAGTGKTALLRFVRVAAESQGWHVAGHSSGAEQAAVMQKESGISSTTTSAWLLEAERAPVADREVKMLFVMDESSQAGAAQYLNSLIATEKLGGRAVLLGDRYQHQSVEAGRAFARSQSHMPMATLGATSIRRQRTQHAKEAVQRVLSGDHAAAVRGLKAVEVRDRQAGLPETATRHDRREAARADNAKVIQRLAADYVALRPAQRARTLIVTSTNADRQAINQEIRARMAVFGELGRSTDVAILRKTNLTRAELTRASSYTPGQVVEVQNDYRRVQLSRGAQFRVIDTTGDCLRLRDAEGQDRLIDPSAVRFQAYEKESRALAVGERIRWIENHRCARADRPSEEGLKVRNGSGAVVEQLSADGRRITLRTDAGEQIQIDARAGAKLDHSYAMTSYAAQGVTVDALMLHHNVESGQHGDRETYVSISRAREEITLYTQDVVRASRQSGVTLDKSSAHDVYEPSPDTTRYQTRDHSPERGLEWGM